MALFQQPRWLRRWIRRRMNPIPIDRAALWKKRLSVMYGLLAWNALGWIGYMIYTGRNDWPRFYGYKTEEEAAMSQAIRYAKQLNMPNAHVMKFSGFSKTDEYELKDMEVIHDSVGPKESSD
ncbi:uncharacterized protein LOC129763647 [Toxorhynchites rutilus septentrionalis]|uniref:uncharacterized protein LOC129763647 n=1 Tax=Toxorhynchites rutilus septentrionalis TaxID=329112 RepID=UPI00247A6B76|nr:uncharacterized protein LOC129763647 [Toxorhynchites rutilus septentrionalis]